MHDAHDQSATTLGSVGPATRISLHPLASRASSEEWIVGRVVTGEFAALPDIGMRAIRLLGDGLTVGQAARRLYAETGEEADLTQFVNDLITLGFVAGIDGHPVPQPEPPRPTLPRLTSRHVRFALHPGLPAAVCALVVTATAALIACPDLVPEYRDLLWSGHGSAVVGLSATAGWLLLVLHELGHLVVARATGVPARIRFGTRLQFLVLQTDISGIELAGRRHRLTAYMAGIAVNLTFAASGVLALTAIPSGTTAHRLLSALVLIALLPLPFQMMVFMRTDVYFVLQDLTGCHELFADGRAYAAYRMRRMLHILHRGRPVPADPSAELPPRERAAVRTYSIVLVVGTAVCLATLAAITLPAEFTLLADAAAGLSPDASPARQLDNGTVLMTIGGAHALWAITWWRGRRRARQD